MKRFFAWSVVLMIFSIDSFAKGCHMEYAINGSIYPCNGTSVTIDTLINPGDTIDFHVGMATNGGCIFPQTGMCNVMITIWRHNGIIVDSCNYYGYCHNYVIADTGSYSIFAGGESCGGSSLGPFIVNLNVHYSTVASTGKLDKNNFQVLPSNSTGIYKIKSNGQRIKEIRIFDVYGRTMYFSSHADSEIDLTNFSTGVYFYLIQNDAHSIFKGKIVRQ